MSKATVTVHWATGPVDVCEDHAEQLLKVADLLGTHVGVEKASKNSDCVTCKQESLLEDTE